MNNQRYLNSVPTPFRSRAVAVPRIKRKLRSFYGCWLLLREKPLLVRACVAICALEHAWVTLTFQVCLVTALSSPKAALRRLEGEITCTERHSQVIISIQLSEPQSVLGYHSRERKAARITQQECLLFRKVRGWDVLLKTGTLFNKIIVCSISCAGRRLEKW